MRPSIAISCAASSRSMAARNRSRPVTSSSPIILTKAAFHMFRTWLSSRRLSRRAGLERVQEGESSDEGVVDSDGVVVDRPVKLAVTVAIKDGIASFDFSNSDPQARGPVNLRPSMVEACVFYALIGCLGPNLHFNDGMRDVVRLRYAPRTVTNAEPPAPVSNYQMVNLKLVDVLLEALGRFHPVRAIANAGSASALTIAWAKGRCGQATMQYEIIGSAYGGGKRHDGAPAPATPPIHLPTPPTSLS